MGSVWRDAVAEDAERSDVLPLWSLGMSSQGVPPPSVPPEEASVAYVEEAAVASSGGQPSPHVSLDAWPVGGFPAAPPERMTPLGRRPDVYGDIFSPDWNQSVPLSAQEVAYPVPANLWVVGGVATFPGTSPPVRHVDLGVSAARRMRGSGPVSGEVLAGVRRVLEQGAERLPRVPPQARAKGVVRRVQPFSGHAAFRDFGAITMVNALSLQPAQGGAVRVVGIAGEAVMYSRLLPGGRQTTVT